MADEASRQKDYIVSVDNGFAALVFLAVYVTCLLVLDASHRSHISALKEIHAAEEAGMRQYIRTLNRERKWLEAELAKVKAKLEQQRQQVTADPVHIQWLPPSEEWNEEQ